MNSYQFDPIGVIRSPYKEKFSVPRQPGLVEDGTGELLLYSPYHVPETTRGLDEFSHIWLIFVFDRCLDAGWHPTVRPPRLGGNTRIGVFATRSPFRPNPIGMSLVELKGIEYHADATRLQLGSLDLVDGTPVLDIKPYIPYTESLSSARAGYAQEKPEASIMVSFTADADQLLFQHQKQYPHLRRFISQVLSQDPRPAYRKKNTAEQHYAVSLLIFNVRWRMKGNNAEVFAIEPL